MNEKYFEIAFSGVIAEDADLEKVKLQIGKLFKADESRLAHLFSGHTVIIKRQVDEATAAKYRGAFERAGAICEVLPLSPSTTATESASGQQAAQPAASTDASSAENYQSKYPESDLVPQALLSNPLGARAETIQDLVTDIAPVGSPMQHQIKEDPEPSFDLSGLEVAPTGSVLSLSSNDEPPPPPDTTGLSIAD